MKRFMTAAVAAALFFGASAYVPAFAQGKGAGVGKRGGKGQHSGPKDGTGKQQGKGEKGKKTGPRDGTGPIHTPPQK